MAKAFKSKVMQNVASRTECWLGMHAGRNTAPFAALEKEISAVCPEAVQVSAASPPDRLPHEHLIILGKAIDAMQDPAFARAVALHSRINHMLESKHRVALAMVSELDAALSNKALNHYADQLVKRWHLAQQYLYLQTAVQVVWPALQDNPAAVPGKIAVFLNQVDAVAERLKLMAASGQFPDDAPAIIAVADQVLMQAEQLRNLPAGGGDPVALKGFVLAVSNAAHPLMQGPVTNIMQRINGS